MTEHRGLLEVRAVATSLRSGPSRNVGLDLLRCAAVFLVLGRHLDAVPAESGLLSLWRRGGWVGVDLFFVLSGYLVSGLLFDEYRRLGTVDIKRFLIRRGWKIYPAFWVFIAVSLAHHFLAEAPQPPLRMARATLAELLFVQNYVPGLWPHTWSLAVEEHFYIGLAVLTAYLLARCPQNPFRSIPVIFLFLAPLCLILRLWTALGPATSPTDWHRFAGTHLRIDSLFFGVLLSYLDRFRGLRDLVAGVPSLLLVALGVGLLMPAFIWEAGDTTWLNTWGVTLFYLAGGSLLLAATRMQTTDARMLRMLAGVGTASYSIYLWHNAINWWIALPAVRALGIRWYPAYVALYVCGACVFGFALAAAIEMPLLTLRDRWFPSNRAPVDKPLALPS